MLEYQYQMSFKEIMDEEKFEKEFKKRDAD